MNTHHLSVIEEHYAKKSVPECYLQLAGAIVGTHKTKEKFKSTLH